MNAGGVLYGHLTLILGIALMAAAVLRRICS